jgi:hypothetical protein
VERVAIAGGDAVISHLLVMLVVLSFIRLKDSVKCKPTLYHKVVATLTALSLDWELGNGNFGRLNEAKWEAQLARLVAHKAERGDCNVPQGWAKDAQLGSWLGDPHHPPRNFRPQNISLKFPLVSL